MKKIINIILGSITLGLGVMGIFLPILPTTPFLLLSAFFYLRSSNRLYTWLINHRIFGKYIYNYMEKKAIPKAAKLIAIIFICISISITVILIDKLLFTIIIPFIAFFVIVHLLKLKTLETKTCKPDC